ncbi:MAG: hypothetical protein CL947_04740 [Epsilonproteobacteria bacterium]|nr:hypothetical protein [Campylobacterota bacterium]|tara:strand:- start:6484 stop:7590 length:1107 start_codon:yes stop_codon:yes gene_type:complete
MSENSTNNESQSKEQLPSLPVFTGHVYIFSAFDIGEDIKFDSVKKSKDVQTEKVNVSKFLKNYHLPLEIELPHPHDSARCISSKIHPFGAISLIYKVPITSTLQDLRQTMIDLDAKYQQDSIQDAYSIFKKIKPFTVKPSFFQLKTYYTVIQIDTKKDLSGPQIKEMYGHEIASLLRFETQTLSDYQKDDIISSSIGYFKKDLVIIDTEAAFIYDPQYEELLDFFELGNIQQLELHYFDKLLDKQLTTLYDQKKPRLPILSYMPFIGSRYFDPIGDLNRIKVDISVITERLESSIKIIGEAYFSEVYDLIITQLDLQSWQRSINKKLNIIKDIRYVYQNKVDANREDLLSVLIIILIMIEVFFAMTKH